MIHASKARYLTFKARRTIIIASWRERSVSSINCSAPPLNISVTVLALGQPRNKLYLKKKRKKNLKICSRTKNIGHVQRGYIKKCALPFASDLHFFEVFAPTQYIICEGVYTSLDGATARFHRPPQVFVYHTSGAKDVAISKILSGNITDWKFRQNNFRTTGNNFF